MSRPFPEGSPTATPEEAPQPRPPDATVSGAAGTLALEQGSYCWSEVRPDGSASGVCADTIGPGEQTPGFGASAEAVLTFALETDEAPDRVELFVTPVDDEQDRTQVELQAANPTTYEVRLEPSSYYIVVSTLWPQGDASYHVRLDVS